MKLLHLAAGNLFGGVESYLLTHARFRNLCPRVQPHFGLCFSGRLRDELVAAGVPVWDLGAVRVSRPWTVIRARRRLRRLVSDGGVEVVVTHGMWLHAIFGPAVRRTRARLVTVVHDFLEPQQWINAWAARTPPDVAVANSQYTARSVPVLFPNVPVETMSPPVQPPTGDRESARREVRAELGVSQETVVVFQASRLERWKGQTVHLDALARLKDLPGWEVWFAGGPQKAGEAEYLAELRASAERNGIAERVKFLGQRSDVPRLMAAADLYCQPNTGSESFGIVFVEALYTGLPVIASRSGGAAEVVTDSCGVLCPAGDVEAVASTLRRLASNVSLRREMARNGPSRASALCDPAAQLARFADVVAIPESSGSLRATVS